MPVDAARGPWWNARVSNKSPQPDSTTAATRRRWVTLGEVLAVLAVMISGLTLWNSWSERRESDAAKTAEAQKTTDRAGRLLLLATNSGKRVLSLKAAGIEQSVQGQTIAFPSALGLKPVETTGEPRIEGGWFEDALKQARQAAHLPDDSRGDEAIPLAITTRFLVDGEEHEDVAIYDVGYGITGHFLGGHTVTLRGISLVARVKAGAAQARLDTRWRAMLARG
jgi:hypothetical protein